jgi:hypothetical protein
MPDFWPIQHILARDLPEPGAEMVLLKESRNPRKAPSVSLASSSSGPLGAGIAATSGESRVSFQGDEEEENLDENDPASIHYGLNKSTRPQSTSAKENTILHAGARENSQGGDRAALTHSDGARNDQPDGILPIDSLILYLIFYLFFILFILLFIIPFFLLSFIYSLFYLFFYLLFLSFFFILFILYFIYSLLSIVLFSLFI